MHNELFRELGLTENEIKVYNTLLDLGASQAGQITEKSGVHRRNVYDSISRLMEKGLVSFVTINNKKLFSPANPEKFLEIIDEKKFELDDVKKRFQKIIPELVLKTAMQEKHDVRFFKGSEGLKTVFEDIMRTRKGYIGYGPGGQIEKILKHSLDRIVAKMAKARITMKLVYNEGSRKIVKREKLAEIRFVPDEYSSHAAMRIYGDKVAILLLTEKDPLAIVIKNAEIAEGYRKYFNVIWKGAKN
ncbi:MAG TPA: helix-turn-helix domain-containing protein [Candidatus Nanoarchaeia archaeon]|nr:helix-turn-helix domain-containing protein [Candidatus Nanoarchaeia archaeon]